MYMYVYIYIYICIHTMCPGGRGGGAAAEDVPSRVSENSGSWRKLSFISFICIYMFFRVVML